jgi:urease accessory protein
MSSVLAQPHWQARLELEFTQQAQRTVISRRQHYGPLVIQKPFYPADGVCHVYVLHPPGGVVAGDQLELQVQAQRDTRVLLTTPAATKFYRSSGATASLHQHLHVADGACLEWLPQETILYNGADVNLQTRITLAATARFIGWEILCLGRPAAHEIFATGQCRQAFELWRNTEPLVIERTRLQGGDASLQANWGYQGAPVSATLLASAVSQQQFNLLREQAAPYLNIQSSLTWINGQVIARFLGGQAREALALFQRLWQILRPWVIGVEACAPRIWAT